MKESFTLKFYPLPDKNNVAESTIYGRIRIQRKKAEFSTGIRIKTLDWDEINEIVKKDKRKTAEIGEIRRKILRIKDQLLLNDRPISAKIVKDIYTDKVQSKAFLLIYFQSWIERMKQMPQEYTKPRIRKYELTLAVLKKCLDGLGKDDILLNEIDYSFVQEFEMLLLTQNNPVLQRPLSRTSANDYHRRFKAVIHRAIKEGLMNQNPYQDFVLRDPPAKRDFLSRDEIDRLKEHPLGGDATLDKVRDIFLFSVYTGLRSSDAKTLKMDHIEKDHEGNYWLRTRQQKTGRLVSVPILDSAMEIIKKYEDSEERGIEGLVLPKVGSRLVNEKLKIIAAYAQINKNLSHHIARHTFATTITLANDVPLEVVSELLGHANLRTTRIYAKITQQHLGRVMSDLNKKISGVKSQD